MVNQQERIFMKKIVIFITLLASVIFFYFSSNESNDMMPQDDKGRICIATLEDVATVYPQNSQQIIKRAEELIQKLKTAIGAIITCPIEQQSKETMLYAFDRAYNNLSTEMGVLELLASVHPDEKMVQTAQEQELLIQATALELISQNRDLYQAFQCYYDNIAQQETLLPEEQYALEELLADWKRAGLDLPEEQRKKIIEVQKELQKLGQEFDANIAQDTTVLVFDQAALQGVSQDFLARLNKTENGKYTIHLDYPSADQILNYCVVEETRKIFAKAFKNRAYPKNVSVLQRLVEKRHELAQLLGFESYAALDLDDQMVKTPERAYTFQNDIYKKLVQKAQGEWNRLLSDLPEGVELDKNGKVKSWDSGYISTYFKKKYYDIDEQKIAEYFPMEETIKGLLHIYEQFFNLTITQVSCPSVWHEDVRLLQVADDQKRIRGYIFLDMFPRPKKYSHAACFSAVHSILTEQEKIYPAVATVVCNFTPPTADKPSLLRYSEVNTFFHEFGHAIHHVLGATHLASQSGTSVKRDFVELPSQLLENWLEEKDILKNLSHHYQTGEQLPDNLIDKKLEQIKFGEAIHYARQVALGLIALDCFDSDVQEDIDTIVQKRFEECTPQIAFDVDTHFQCNFGHLHGYGAKYYGYLWSNVFAADVFEQIKKEGLLNSQAGKRYETCILGKGGSKDPNILLYDYLGRKPEQDAFLRRLGL